VGFSHIQVDSALQSCCNQRRSPLIMRRPFLLLLALCSLLSSPCQAEPLSLFDGKTLTGWDFDPAVWRVEDGVITGGSTTEKIPKNFFISTQRSFQNFELKLKIKCSGDPKTGLINSGIQIRSVRDRVSAAVMLG
jgi:hypothetical protein